MDHSQTALLVSNGRQGPPNMKIKFYRYFDFYVSRKITINNCQIVDCSRLQKSYHDERQENTEF